MQDDKKFAVWRILRDGPFKATPGGYRSIMASAAFTREALDESSEDGARNAAWMVDGTFTPHVVFVTYTTSAAIHLGRKIFSGGSIRLIRNQS